MRKNSPPKEFWKQLIIAHDVDNTEMAWEEIQNLAHTLWWIVWSEFVLTFWDLTLDYLQKDTVSLAVGASRGGIQGKCGGVVDFILWVLDRDLTDPGKQLYLVLSLFGDDREKNNCSERITEDPHTEGLVQGFLVP